ncbi:MAG: EamA family transporter [Synergistaceae bacterium]|nr:EamA family transporter [Synergistaceae bacterium]
MLYIFTAGVLWGTIGIFVKLLASLGADGNLTSFLRMLSAFVIMSTLALIKHGRNFFIHVHDKEIIIPCALLGLVSHGLFNIFYTASIKINGMAIACVLMYTAPVFTALASKLLFHEKFTGLKISALIINILGCVLTVTGGNIFNNDNLSLIGILAGIGSGFGYGMAAIFGKSAGEKTDALIISAYSYFFAMIFLLIFRTPDINFALANPKILLMGILYGLIPTSLAYLVYYNGLQKIHDTSRVPVIASIEPVAAVLIGMLIYNEEIGFANFIGVAVVLVSIIIMVRAK